METFGWDTVSVIAVDRINAALAAHSGELLQDFDADPGTDPPVTATGRYGAWSIVPGGSERYLYLSLPIESGRLSIGASTAMADLGLAPPPAADLDATEYDLAGVAVVVQLNLKFTAKDPERGREIQFELNQVGHAGSNEPGFVTPVRVIDPSGRLTVAASSLLGVCVADDLVKNAGRIGYVLSRVSLVPPAIDAWLAPKKLDYACGARENGGTPFLGVLASTTDRDVSALPRQVDPEALRQDGTAALLVSDGLFLHDAVLPILPRAYETGADSFLFDAAGRRIRQAHAFDTFTVRSGAIDYRPRIDEFAMYIQGDAMRTELAGTCDLKAGIWMRFSVSMANRTGFDPNTKKLSFVADPNPRSDYSADIPWYFWLLGPIAIGITEICVRVISQDIGAKITELLRNALSITDKVPTIVQWTDTDGFTVNEAGLAGCLFIRGAVRPAAGQGYPASR